MDTALVFAAFLAPEPMAFDPFPPPVPVIAPAPREPAPVVTYREEYRLVNGVLYRVVTPAAPGVAAPQPFRGGVHAGHSCPSCGTPEYRVAGFNRDGTHTHTCPRCGTSWRH